MTGEIDNTHSWDDADVLVSFNLDAPTPASIDDDFGEDWVLVGFLDGSAGFSENVDEPRTAHRAWGAGVIKTSHKGAEVSVDFKVLEDNATTERLARPNLREKVRIAFETREDGAVRRRIAREPAKVRRSGARVDNEDALAALMLKADIFPDVTVDAGDEDPFWQVQETTSGS